MRNESSKLEIYDLGTKQRTVLKEFDGVIEAPNWTKDGKALIYNGEGRIWRFDLATKAITQVDTGACDRCNNDHVLSADGTMLAISSSVSSEVTGGFESNVYVLPMGGGTPRRVTKKSPSFLHGWSPDGKTLAYCAFRDRERGGDIWAIDVNGGEEWQITDTEGLNDGPEYSPDGKKIWFNSVRTGLMQAYVMNADGSEQTQMTFDEDLNTWFPHISPDGKKVLMISYHKGDLEPGEHLPGKNVLLRLMDAAGGTPETIVELYGGQGTVNVNSWAPDSTRFAFVSYRDKGGDR